MPSVKIALIPGDGIGTEVLPEGVRVLLPIRRAFDQYVNLRPVRLFAGVPCPLANKHPGDIDFYIVRENVEGEYSSVGGIQYEGTEHEIVSQQSTFTRRGTDRILKYAFELAQSRPERHLTSATKSNGIFHSMPYWDNLKNWDAPWQSLPEGNMCFTPELAESV